MDRRTLLGAMFGAPLIVGAPGVRAQETVDLDVPFVTTPQNAFNTFTASGMDALVLGNTVITKE